MGATLTQQIILFEEISRVGAPTPYPHGLSFIGPLIIDAGTPEQKAKHLPPILTGDVTWCQGYSETGAGSDLASLTTRAELDGDTSSSTATRSGPPTAISPIGCSRWCAPTRRRSRATPASACC